MDPEPAAHVRADATAPADEQLVRALRDELAGAGDLEALASRMALLADARRLRILFCLHAHPGVRSSDIARVIDAGDSATSHALALLREAGWVRAERSGREVRYALADELAHTLLHALGSQHLPGVHHHDETPHRHV